MKVVLEDDELLFLSTIFFLGDERLSSKSRVPFEEMDLFGILF